MRVARFWSVDLRREEHLDRVLERFTVSVCAVIAGGSRPAQSVCAAVERAFVFGVRPAISRDRDLDAALAVPATWTNLARLIDAVTVDKPVPDMTRQTY